MIIRVILKGEKLNFNLDLSEIYGLIDLTLMLDRKFHLKLC